MQRIAGDDTAFERSMRRTSNAPLASLRPGALRDAKAIRASAAKTLTMCNGVLLLPRSYAPRSALPSMATTPVSLIHWPWRKLP